MQINITGHGIEITPALRTYTTEKFDRLNRLADKISNVNIIFDVEKVLQIAKATVNLAGTEIHARSESENMYSAIDNLLDKLKLQITKHKEKHQGHRDNG